MNSLDEIKNLKVDIDKIEDDILIKRNISLSVLRLDKIHPVISGNKLFKLHYFLEHALVCLHRKIITFGGAFSNHLAATAAACKELNIKCIGIVRGERPKNLSHTLLFCEQQNMYLKFISRNKYAKKFEDDFLKNLKLEFGEHILIPEGGFNHDGVNGAAEIARYYCSKDYTHVCCAVGTGTTLAGLIKSDDDHLQYIGFSALKNLNDFDVRIRALLGNNTKNYNLICDYHFGGFAKKNHELISFMNQFYDKYSIRTDFVYTGKMMYGIWDLISNNYFSEGNKILCIHTGGLQGNVSLPKGLLNF